MKKIILTGSKGLIGSELLKFLNKKYKILELDLKLGHDLTNEKFVKKWSSNSQVMVKKWSSNGLVMVK